MNQPEKVKIGVIDSGINPYHSHIDGVAGGVFLSVGKDLTIEYRDDFRDRLGHGTAVAAAVRAEMPECDLYAIRVFDEKLATYPTVLCAALEWAIDQGMDIVNLSLGTCEENAELRQLCTDAKKAGRFVVAALDERRGMKYPAAYEGVLAVSAGELVPGTFRYEGGNRFSACGYPRELKGDMQKYNLHGHSFAAARFSGIIARHWMEADEPRSYQQILQKLCQPAQLSTM